MEITEITAATWPPAAAYIGCYSAAYSLDPASTEAAAARVGVNDDCSNRVAATCQRLANSVELAAEGRDR